jgi:hypothetical protein
MTNDEIRMTNQIRMTNDQMTKTAKAMTVTLLGFVIRIW